MLKLQHVQQQNSNNELERARRFHAVRLKHQGWKQGDIAIALYVNKGAVSQWITMTDVHGQEILCGCLHTGRPPELTAEGKRMLPDFHWRGAGAYGFRGFALICPRVRKAIEILIGATYHRSHIARLLKELNWMSQRSIERATQRDEVEIALW